jgi:CPA2 family monovalent cation:H+ antiporter-2
LQIVATLFVILFGKSIAAYVIVRVFGRPRQTALTISASLAQIGEFSFILSAIAVSFGLLPPQARDLIITGAILSILANPFWFRIQAWWESRIIAQPQASAPLTDVGPQPTPYERHAVVVGFGRVGSVVAEGFRARGVPVVVVEARRDLSESARVKGFRVVQANAAQPGINDKVNLVKAQWLIVAIPNGFEAGQIVEHARAANADINIFARAHFDAEVEHLTMCGADFTVMGEREIAKAFLNAAIAV